MGKILTFRNAEAKDAAFIPSLRTDADKSCYLSALRGKLAEQEAWLVRYGEAALSRISILTALQSLLPVSVTDAFWKPAYQWCVYEH